jgi:hypothetical protein
VESPRLTKRTSIPACAAAVRAAATTSRLMRTASASLTLREFVST